MSGYSKEDAAKDTGVSTSKVSENWHKARNDAAAEGSLAERNANKVKDSEDGPILHEIFKALGFVK